MPATLDPRTGQPWNEHQNGMSLRDYFAAAALQGIMANHSVNFIVDDGLTAVECYQWADAMLKARNHQTDEASACSCQVNTP